MPERVPSVTVTGHGSAAAVPDEIRLRFATRVQSASVADALDGSNDGLAAMIRALRGGGVADADLQTAQVSVGSVYRERQSDPRQFEVMQSVQVRLRDVYAARSLIVDVLAAGGDAAELSEFGWGISDSAELVLAAREAAFADARDRAGHYARLCGGRLGDVLAVREQQFSGGRGMRFEAASARRAAAIPLEPGRDDVDLSVEVEWALLD